MSVNLNSNIIKAVQPQVDRAPISYNFQADVWAIGGGAGGFRGGAAVTEAGGGGGAGMVVSSSLSIVPNITWTIEVGGGGVESTSGQDTMIVAYNNDYSGLTTFRAQGGRVGRKGVGGNSGTGSLETTAVTHSYSGYTGGAEVTGGGRNSAGGGAGSTGNGLTGTVYDGNPGTGIGGAGGAGNSSLSPIGAIAGGGGGGIGGTTLGGPGGSGGGKGGEPTSVGQPATNYGAGGGGGYGGGSSAAGTGFRGAAVIKFAGEIGTQLNQFDIEITNATTFKDGGDTWIVFNSGSGTFRYNAPYPYVPGN